MATVCQGQQNQQHPSDNLPFKEAGQWRERERAIRSPIEDRLTGSVHGNVYGTEQGMEEVVQKQT
jgi:hypothetical protein